MNSLKREVGRQRKRNLSRLKPEGIVIYTCIVHVFFLLFLEEIDNDVSKRGKEDLDRAFKNIIGYQYSPENRRRQRSVKCNPAEHESVNTLTDEG